MFPCLGGMRWWPLTAMAGIFHAPIDKVVRTAQPWKAPRGSPWRSRRHPDLEEAVGAHAPYLLGVETAAFAVASRDGEWTAALSSAAPVRGDLQFLRARAAYDVKCEFVGVEWAPAGDEVFANATFTHLQAGRGLFRRSRLEDARWIQASDQDETWEFDAVGEPLPFEEPQRYTARRKADRLGLDMLGRYLAALGVPVDDAGWLTGPVVAAVRQPHPLAVRPGAQPWSTPEDLRRVVGYPQDHVPTDLMGWN
jgi:hypothetical protein